jgi:outer membrane protein assembly factor BamB
MGFAADLAALAPADGERLWRATPRGTYNFTDGPPGAALAAGEGRVVVGVRERLHAFDAATGDPAWSVDAATTAPAVADGVVSTGGVGVAAADGAVRWRFEVGDDVESSPAVVGNVVYVGSDDYHCYALAANSGAVVWRARTDGPVRSSPAVGDEAVYVGSADGALHAFDRADGSERWAFDAGAPVESSPTLADGTVYVGSRGGVLFAVDAAEGRERWRVDYGGGFERTTPAVVDGTVYAGANGVLRALSTADGSEEWRVDFGTDDLANAVPVAVDGRVVVNPDETVHALDAADGTTLWSRPTGPSVLPAPAVRGGTVYTGGGTTVEAFDLATGDRRWRTAAGVDPEVVAGEAAVYLRSHGSSIVALAHEDGRVLWERDGVTARGSPAVAGDYLFVGDADGGVRALGPEPE